MALTVKSRYSVALRDKVICVMFAIFLLLSWFIGLLCYRSTAATNVKWFLGL